MNLRELGYLVALAEHRHFGRAAEACFVSQPTLSMQIRKLEEELGVTLVERTPRRVALTAAGERVVERARVILRETDNIRGIARHAQDPEAGTLRVGLFPTLSPYLLPHIVPALHERFPQVELLLVEEKSDVLLQRVRDGQLDTAFLALPTHGHQLHQEPLFDEEFVLAVPTGDPLARSDGPVRPSVLAGQNLLLLEEGHCLRDQALDVCSISGAAERTGFRATSLETLRQMVAAGVGLTLLPELAVTSPAPTPDGVALVRFEQPAPHRTVALFWRPSSVYADLLATVASHVRGALGDLPVRVLEG